MREIDVAISDRQAEAGMPPADDVRINDLAPVTRAAGDVVELAQMRGM